MAADVPAVEIHDADVIHRLKVQYGSFPDIKRNSKRSSVAYGLVDTNVLLQSGKLGFRGEGHHDCIGIEIGKARLVADGTIPNAIEGEVRGTHHLRAGILRQYLIGSDWITVLHAIILAWTL